MEARLFFRTPLEKKTEPHDDSCKALQVLGAERPTAARHLAENTLEIALHCPRCTRLLSHMFDCLGATLYLDDDPEALARAFSESDLDDFSTQVLAACIVPDSLVALRHAIEAAIPVGTDRHRSPVEETKEFRLLWQRFGTLDDQVHNEKQNVLNQCGTLGGGNHFIELNLDTHQNVWMMLHSGSRHIGKTLAEIHIGRAKKLRHNQDLPDRDLATFLANTPEMKAYLNDLHWAQEYAMANRRVMLKLYADVLERFFPQMKLASEMVLCHHNYVSEEVHFGEQVLVTRKGAISARQGEMGIIPGSMGTRSYIVRGLGNPDSFQSASHGAGRLMSHMAAKKKFTEDDLLRQTTGVECRKDRGVLDEIPSAYKPIEQVMQNQRDLVEVVAELKQVLVVKG